MMLLVEKFVGGVADGYIHREHIAEGICTVEDIYYTSQDAYVPALLLRRT